MHIKNTQITWETQMLENVLAWACQHVYITRLLIHQQQATDKSRYSEQSMCLYIFKHIYTYVYT